MGAVVLEVDALEMIRIGLISFQLPIKLAPIPEERH
jgi:hypothetical protein